MNEKNKHSDHYYNFRVENAKFAILFRKLQKSMFFEKPPHNVTWSDWDSSSRVVPTGEYGGHLSDVLDSQSQHVNGDLLANELCARGVGVFRDGVSLHRR